MTTTQVASLLGLSRQRVFQLISEGRLPAEKFGRMYLIQYADAVKMKVYGTRGRPGPDAKPRKFT